MSRMLEVANLDYSYGRAQVLFDVSFDADEGEIVTIIGPNGAGKSTLLNVVARSHRLRRGTIRIGGQATDRLSQAGVVKIGCVLVPEGRQVFSSLTVRDNLVLGGYVTRRDGAAKATVERVFDIFPRLAERSDQLAGTLSGGEQQMLAIGRAMLSRPKVMLLDEPSLGLAPQMTARIMDVLGELRRESGLTIVLVEQNAHAALGLADRGYLMSGGRMLASGTSAELKADKIVQQVYLGASAEPEPERASPGTAISATP
ncbi:ABC transporter ATP-binding protein [Arthrobacter ginkgonis]|uniref:ABC transporter ATP-binding protein n=1 Tax=Arthrobacter ginkgonis TaxID=1630594 RepID=A0ABP7DEL8_9MICC